MSARFLLTNDDGVGAPGLVALFDASEALGDPLVVAPAGPRSGSGHAVTTTSPVKVRRLFERWYGVEGMPADCSRIGLCCLAPETAWVLSGINYGGNLGVDVYTSGTVAAVREAAILGYRGIALSQYVRRGLKVDWEVSTRLVRRVLSELFEMDLPEGSYCNVNLPHLPPGSPEPEVVFCDVDPAAHQVRFRHENGEEAAESIYHYEGVYADRSRTPGHDVDVCFSGRIAVSILHRRGRHGEAR